MTTPALYKRIVRRESHSPRSGAAITIAIILMLGLAYLGVESVLAAIGQPPLLLAPETLVSSTLSAASAPVPLLVAIGAVAAIIGLVLIVVSFAPGRRGRRGAASDRTAAVVDDRVIAQSIARTVSYAGDVDPDNVRVTVGTRTVRVDVTPTSGRAVDRQAIQDAVAEDVASYDYRPALRSTLHVSKKGKVA
ncbi:hypothetical protein B7R54_15675 [Subtercola boreus]|uniref:DNA/RNA endonuclease G n=1 Tax=Subtercola boreus TaxID=120213 RepID=A0A3E0VM23_9MICO|nr:DUF6286 domain-containing protein [Subtercola boreus]RFA10480.1 hypothetical protein B7R54_15675 [Subtercola boreus]TQL55985.1 hypothetical protein FB464_3561 [Subtercola boreus]